jgi:hypothetical protein
MVAIVDPWQADAVMVAKAMPPFWQYFLCLQSTRQTSPYRTPKDVNHGPPSLFPCKRAASGGPRKGATMRITDPRPAPPAASPPSGGEGHAPVAAVLVPAVKTRARI